MPPFEWVGKKDCGAFCVPEWELLVYTRQFSYEWQIQDLQDTELGRVCKPLKGEDEKSDK
jgi:hypothetical protein